MTDSSGAEIPQWKREMLAKKAAEKGKKEAEAWHEEEIRRRKMANVPEWKKQLMEKRQQESQK